MAINLNESILDHKREAYLDPAYVGPLERGMIMVYTANLTSDGTQMVMPCTGASGEKVAGMLWLSENTQADVPVIEDADVPALAPYTSTLRSVPLALGTIRAINRTTGAAITVVAGAPGAGQLGLTGRVLTADAALAGVPIRVVYRYPIDPRVLARRGGRRSINNGGERPYGQVTLCYGTLRPFLSNFDTSQAYDPAGASKTIYCGLAGKVTSASGGTALGQLTHTPVSKLTPGIEQAFIAVEMRLPVVP